MAEMINDTALEERRFGRTVVAFVIIGFAAVLAAGLAAGLLMVDNQRGVGWVDHTYEVERQVMTLRLSLEEMRSARRGVVLKIRGDSGRTYEEAVGTLYATIRRIGRLTIDSPVQQRNVAELDSLAGALDKRFRESMRPDFQPRQGSEANRQTAAGQVQGIAERMLAYERGLLGQRQRAQREGTRNFYLVIAAAGLLVLLVGIGSIWVIRRYTRELNTSRGELQRLNEDLEGAVVERTVDLQRANDEIQRFAYIVSHDLRSPLVNVMGFTAELDAAIKPLSALIDAVEAENPKLLSHDAREAVRTDLPESVGFIRTSTQKMDRLINAILRLSREGRRTISPETLNLEALAQTVIDGLRHRIDELGIDVQVASKLPSFVTDRLAIEQILSNLVENAVKYRALDRPTVIRIEGHQQHGRAIIEVIDNGRGIEKRDHERVFDLFRRSGVQDQTGEGIGLAHVRALAYRLGGTIGVESELGQGATFRINLPLIYSGEKGIEA